MKEIYRIQSKRWRDGNYERKDNRLVGQTKIYYTVNQRSKNKRNWEWNRGNIWRYKDWTVCKAIRKHQYMDSRSITNHKQDLKKKTCTLLETLCWNCRIPKTKRSENKWQTRVLLPTKISLWQKIWSKMGDLKSKVCWRNKIASTWVNINIYRIFKIIMMISWGIRKIKLNIG